MKNDRKTNASHGDIIIIVVVVVVIVRGGALCCVLLKKKKPNLETRENRKAFIPEGEGV